MLLGVVMVQVPGFNRSQPQYAYAVGAIALVLLQTFVRIAITSYDVYGKIETSTLGALVAAEAVILAFGTIF
jgi:hypothetical protein